VLPYGRVLRRPRILALGALIAALVTAFVSLGLWQLRRLDERIAFNDTLLARTSLPTVAFEDLPVESASTLYRRVVVTGTYRTQDEVLIVGRSRNTLAGHHLVTPLGLADGTLLLVNRGWVPLDVAEPPVETAAPPAGTVRVTGVLFPPQERGRFGPRHAPEGALVRFFRIDVLRIEEQLDAPVHDLYLLLESQDPPQVVEFPASLDLPRLDEGPHRSYALQWFAFALIAVSTYVAFVVIEARRAASESRRDSGSVA
jgi:cytochrome oxidase assembly protein ShyY1